MPTNSLTDKECRAARPEAKPVKMFDGGGMYLCVLPSGTKSWRLTYRNQGGKAQTHVIGAFPEIGLAAARVKRDEFKAELKSGEFYRRKERAAAAEIEAAKPRKTLKQACEEYWSGRRDVTDKYRTNALRGLEMYLWRELGERDIGAITRAELLAELAKMDQAGLAVYVRKVRLWAGHVWGWAVEHEYATINVPDLINPIKAFSKYKVESFAALELEEMPAFWRRLAIEDQSVQSVLACKMLAYTWVRTKELRSMKWEHIDFEAKLWRIGSEVMGKTKLDHIVPLSRQALEVLDVMLRRKRGDFVFPAEHRDDRPMSDSTVLMLLYRMGYKDRMTGHGWRSVGSTWANENELHEDAIEKQLAHTAKDKVRAVYNRARYLNQRRAILQGYADWLDSLLITEPQAAA